MPGSTSTRILSGKPPESYMERRDVFGLVAHDCSLLLNGQQLRGTAYNIFTLTVSACRTAEKSCVNSRQEKEQRVLCTRRSINCLRSANQSQSRPRQPYE